MDVSCRVVFTRQDDCRVEVEGEIDILSAPRLQADLFAALDARPAGSRVVLDLAGVRFLAVAGVRVLAEANLHAGLHGVVVILGPTSPAVDLILRVTGVGMEFRHMSGSDVVAPAG